MCAEVDGGTELWSLCLLCTLTMPYAADDCSVVDANNCYLFAAHSNLLTESRKTESPASLLLHYIQPRALGFLFHEFFWTLSLTVFLYFIFLFVADTRNCTGTDCSSSSISSGAQGETGTAATLL